MKIQKKDFDKAPWIICSDGNVISKKTNKPRKQFLNKNGYPMVNYRDNRLKKTYNFYVHRLVAELFIGKIPENMCVNHKDGNKQNNHVENLEIVTYGENIKHADRLGLRTCAAGEDNGMSKISNEKAYNLIIDLLQGMSNVEAAEKYQLHSRYISLIRHKRRHKKIWEQVERATTIETTL